jgi:syntaxin 18
MVDRTELFKATVKSSKLMKSRLEKVLEEHERKEHPNKPDVSSSGLSKDWNRSSKPSSFSKKAEEVMVDISKMHHFLLKSRSDYIGTVGHLGRTFGCMSEEERDCVDEAAEKFMKNCSESVYSLQKQIYSDGITGEQMAAHRKAVVEILKSYLKKVCQLYSEQRAIRVKRSVERRQNSRLTSSKTLAVSVDSPEVQELPQSPQCEVTPCPPTPPYQPSFDLSIEEADTFQQENVQLLEQFHDVTDEVRLIQEKVLQISELQSLFTEKVMEQAKNIELVADNAVTSTENVSAGNEEVRGAIKNRATYRAVVLFILIMLSITLLFLNWYS